MPVRARKTDRTKAFVLILAAAFAACSLYAFQFGDRNELNGMRFSQVQALVSDLPKAKLLAQQGNIDLFAGNAVDGKAVRLRGELTDANCFLPNHTHAYDHAFCAKLCAASGSPLLFLSDQDNQIYVVLTSRNAVRLPDAVLDQIGVPGILVNGKVLEKDGIRAFAMEGIAH
jgi:hypothetical protein